MSEKTWFSLEVYQEASHILPRNFILIAQQTNYNPGNKILELRFTQAKRSLIFSVTNLVYELLHELSNDLSRILVN